MEKSSWSKVIIGIVVIVIILIAVFSAQKPEEDKFEVAVILPLTGPVSELGENFLNGMLLAKEKFNSNIVLHIEDSQSNAKDGLTAAKKLLDLNDIDVIVTIQSAVAIPLVNIAEEHDKPLIVSVVSDDKFTSMSKNTFRLFAPARQSAAIVADFANKRGYEKVSILTLQDEYGESMKEHFKKNFKGEISYEGTFGVAERDFRTLLLKTKGSEALYFLGYAPHYINVFKQRTELGMDITLLCSEDLAGRYVQNELGPLFDNAYAEVIPAFLENEKTKVFAEEYKEKYGHEFEWVSPLGYDMFVVLESIKENDKEPIDALYEIKAEGLNGAIAFDKIGEVNFPLVIIEAKDGLIRVVEE